LGWLAGRVAGMGGDPRRMMLSGWSAGGHLTTLCVNEPSVRAGLAISGLYDLEPVRLCYVNDKLGLDADEARRLSPLLTLPSSSNPLFTAYGTAELPELQRQSQEFGAARARAGLPGGSSALPGHNHFTILEELARPDGTLTAIVKDLVISDK